MRSWSRGTIGWFVGALSVALAVVPACSSDGSAPSSVTGTCNGLPTDLGVDTQNCGSCGTLCAGTSAVCVRGVCGCPARAGTCADGCDDLSSDPRNCGACGNACGPGFACVNGSCGCANEALCGDQCADLQSDPSNCGACGDTCGPKQRCVGGSCTGICMTSGDCGAGRMCNSPTWLCVDGTTACDSNLDCNSPTTEYCGLGRCFPQGPRLYTFVAPDSGCAPGTETSNPSLTTCTDHFQTCSPTAPCPNAWLCLAVTPNQVEGTCVQATDSGSPLLDGGRSAEAGESGASLFGSIDGAMPDATVVDSATNDATTTHDDASPDGGATDEAGDDTSADDSGGASSDDAPGE